MRLIDLPDLLIILGGALIIAAAFWIYPPYGMIVAGLELLIVGILASRK